MRICSVVILLGMNCSFLAAQNETLEDYIHEGLSSNLALRQKEVNYQRSLALLRQSRALFYPEISLNARYSVAEGGRIIEFPVGTLLNPVYRSLNLLLGSPQFPDIENIDFLFYRPTEHETKLSLVQPIIEPSILYQTRIKKALSDATREDAATYQRQLVAEIKTAYFNYLKSLRLQQLLMDTRILLEENVRVNESLFDNDKVTIDNVYRSRAELSKLDQRMAESDKNRRMAQAYFNFLLNHPLKAEINAEARYDSIAPVLDLDRIAASAVANREELAMLRSYREAADHQLALNQMRKIPSIFAAVDYGFQGRQYEFNMRQDYLFASLVLRWDIFHGFENKARISQARVEKELRANQLEETEKQIRLQTMEAYYALLAASESVRAANAELQSARRAFRVIDRKYREGRSPLIEFLDARNSQTQAEERLIIARYDYHIRYAELERTACLYPVHSATNLHDQP